MSLQVGVHDGIDELQAVSLAPPNEIRLVREAHGVLYPAGPAPVLPALDVETAWASREPELDTAVTPGRCQRMGMLV